MTLLLAILSLTGAAGGPAICTVLLGVSGEEEVICMLEEGAAHGFPQKAVKVCGQCLSKESG